MDIDQICDALLELHYRPSDAGKVSDLIAHLRDMNKYRKTLESIGAQHPAWSSNKDDKLVLIFNDITAMAREAVNAVGRDDDEKADWCAGNARQRKTIERKTK